MSFMQKYVMLGDWWEIETDREGTLFLPAGLFTIEEVQREYPEVTADDIEMRENCWGARLSAPGYMDCTEWTVHDSEQEAYAYLDEMYGDDEEDVA